MTRLVACLGAGKGTWSEVARLIASESWTAIFLITNEFGRENFSQKFSGMKAEFVVVNDLAPAEQLLQEIKKGLLGKIADTEVAVNMASGTGNVHMALITALLQLGMGMRFVVPSESGAKEL
ncbi:TPA: hypothetical protein HA231_05490 [Candidatus Woesearchaeota archaeon]|nr:hypothetical protein [Candidatus Woesearchaeota archaeon]